MPSLVHDIVQYDFLWRAGLAAVVVAIVAAPLGCCIVWQRMVYFGDALAHTTLLGAALGVLMGMQLQLSIIIICILMALLLVLMQGSVKAGNEISKNTQLGIIAHGSLALSLIVLSLFSDIRFDLYAFLFGDVLSMTNTDLLWLIFTAAGVFTVLFFIWNNLLAMTVHSDLAHVEGVAVRRIQVAFMLLLALVVAIAMKVVGVVLIVSMMIIPAASARKYSRTPESMALLSGFISAVAALFGLIISIVWDLPTGPAIVLMLVTVFVLSQLVPIKK